MTVREYREYKKNTHTGIHTATLSWGDSSVYTKSVFFISHYLPSKMHL